MCFVGNVHEYARDLKDVALWAGLLSLVWILHYRLISYPNAVLSISRIPYPGSQYFWRVFACSSSFDKWSSWWILVWWHWICRDVCHSCNPCSSNLLHYGGENCYWWVFGQFLWMLPLLFIWWRGRFSCNMSMSLGLIFAQSEKIMSKFFCGFFLVLWKVLFYLKHYWIWYVPC